jgi:hypothetical protein
VLEGQHGVPQVIQLSRAHLRAEHQVGRLEHQLASDPGSSDGPMDHPDRGRLGHRPRYGAR